MPYPTLPGVGRLKPKTPGRGRADCSETATLTRTNVLPLLAVLGSLAIAGCAVGPDFRKPAAPSTGNYTTAPLSTTSATPNVAGGEAQHFVDGGDISADWWTLFHSQPLNALIDEALKNNHDLKAARAALSAAVEHVKAQQGAYYPAVTAGASASRQKQSMLISPTPNASVFQYNLYTPEVSVSYTPDVFGLNRRTVESLNAVAGQTRYQMVATYTTLTSNVVVAAIELGALEMQVDATHQLIDANTNMVQILRYQLAKGYANRLDLAAQESQLAQLAATLPPLVKQLEQQRDLLAVLVGRFPSQAPADSFALSSLQLPQDVPVSLPSKLVEQRPDVLQAEENLHAASALIGVAVANRLPNISLTANAGSTALAIGQVFAPGTGFWSLGADLAAPIFDGGNLLHQERAARAAYVQASEQYRSTVLGAFQNVADTLTALEQDADGLKQAAAAEQAARVTFELSQRQLKDGYTNNLVMLNAEQAWQQARINLIQAQANRFADTAALFQALGGGWWHRTELADNDHGN
jgi:NodT family efflux transporter outer membrane factor (OMF) lipoprotein